MRFLYIAFWNIVFILFFPIVTIWVLTTLALFLPFPQKVRDRVFDFVARKWGQMALLLADTKLEIENIEIVPEKPPYLIVFNHGSNFDIFSLFLLPQAYRAVMKKELMYIPFFGLLAWLYGNIPINRQNLRKAMIALDSIKGKFSRYPIFMAITGTRIRNKNFMKHKLKKGPVITAIVNQVPMLPVTVLNADKVHLKGFRPFTPGLTIKIVIHPLMDMDNYSLKEKNEVLSKLKKVIGAPIISELNSEED